MSLPRELLDELLSGYMDGELSADERARVEQMLATDPAVRQHLRTLQEQSEAVRTTIRSTAGLDAAFADRVLAATFAEATRTGVGENHPVRLAATDQTRSFRHASRWKWSAIGGLAVAASLAAAVVLLRDGEGDTRRIATTDPALTEAPQDRPMAAPQPPDGAAPLVAAAQAGGHGREDAAGGAGVEPLTASDPESDSPALESLAADQPATSPRPEPESAIEPQPPAGIGELALDEPLALPLADGQSALRAVLVYEVQVTPLGREQGVINRAFREADIRIANQREVDDALVGYLQSSDLIGGEADEQSADGDRVSVMFLEGPGKQLEKLMLSLLAAEDEIRSVGFSLAMDPPVMAAIDTLEQVDATEIRGDASSVVAHALIPADDSDASAPAAAAKFTAGDRPFVPLGRDSLAGLSSASGPTADGQTDITARTLLIIRFD